MFVSPTPVLVDEHVFDIDHVDVDMTTASAILEKVWQTLAPYMTSLSAPALEAHWPLAMTEEAFLNTRETETEAPVPFDLEERISMGGAPPAQTVVFAFRDHDAPRVLAQLSFTRGAGMPLLWCRSVDKGAAAVLNRIGDTDLVCCIDIVHAERAVHGWALRRMTETGEVEDFVGVASPYAVVEKGGDMASFVAATRATVEVGVRALDGKQAFDAMYSDLSAFVDMAAKIDVDRLLPEEPASTPRRNLAVEAFALLAFDPCGWENAGDTGVRLRVVSPHEHRLSHTGATYLPVSPVGQQIAEAIYAGMRVVGRIFARPATADICVIPDPSAPVWQHMRLSEPRRRMHRHAGSRRLVQTTLMRTSAERPEDADPRVPSVIAFRLIRVHPKGLDVAPSLLSEYALLCLEETGDAEHLRRTWRILASDILPVGAVYSGDGSIFPVSTETPGTKSQLMN